MEKKSMRVKGKRTSLALEKKWWDGLDAYVKEHGNTTIPKVIGMIDDTRDESASSLASAVRIFLYDIALQKSKSQHR